MSSAESLHNVSKQSSGPFPTASPQSSSSSCYSSYEGYSPQPNRISSPRKNNDTGNHNWSVLLTVSFGQ